MPKARLTRTSIDKLEYLGKQTVYFDTRFTGFGVRVSRQSRSYIVQTRVNGKLIFETIGRCDLIDFDKALNKAKAILEDAQEGIAPADRKAEKDQIESDTVQQIAVDAQNNLTVMEVFEKYIVARKNLKPGTIETYREDIDYYIPDWKHAHLRSITSEMVLVRHGETGKRSPARADGVFRLLRALFNFAMTVYEGMVTRNPVTKLSALGAWYKVNSKTSYLKPEDLKKWFPAVLELKRDSSRDYILMLLLTGARAKETSLLKWSDYHAEAGLVYFADTKTGKPLEIPLCKYLLDMLENRRIYFYEGDDSKYIFSSYSGKGRIKSVRTGLKVVEDKSGIRTTLHDLRRSYLTYCENLDISSYTRKRLVNHSIPTDVTEKYTQFSIDRLKTVVESVAEYILINAGVMEQKPQAVLSDKQKIQIQSTAFWKSLSKRQQQLFAKDFSN